MFKQISVAIVLLLMLLTIFSGQLKYLTDWSTPELWGYNLWTLLVILGGGYFVYFKVREGRKRGDEKSKNEKAEK
jgi:hypothetical protein